MPGVPQRPALRRVLSRLVAACAAVSLVGIVSVATGDDPPAEAAWTRDQIMWESEKCGETEKVTVPAGVTKVRILAEGGGGGAGGKQFTGTGGEGGLGGVAEQTYPVSPGTEISMVVGCLGKSGSADRNDAATPGWSKGGGAGIGSTSAFEDGASGGAGGGATGVCIGSATCEPGSSTLRLVAGGGGGGGVTNCSTVDSGNSRGGRGGSTTSSTTSHGGGIGKSGHDGASSNGAGGAGGVNSTAGSADGETSSDGSGGLGVNVVGGGGGGGYRGGKAGGGASTGCVGGGGGGGGSSWVHGTEVGYTGGHCAACVPQQGRVLITMLRQVTTELTSSTNPSRPGQTVSFRAKVYDSAGPHTFTPVEFFRDGVLVGTDQTDLSGVASVSMTFRDAGSYKIEARPQTSFSAEPTSDSLIQRVEDGAPAPAVTSTVVTSAPNPSVAGDEVTFTAEVEADGTPVTAGTVKFENGSTVLEAAAALDASGKATFRTSSLPVGTHTITATYSGTDRFMSSAGDAVHFVEAEEPPAPAATATDLTVTPSPSTYGEKVKVTAAVTREGTPVTAGTVEILVDDTVAHSAAVNGDGVVAWESSSLAPGDHHVQAHYLGTADLAASVSDRLAHHVEKAPTRVTLRSSASPSAPGDEVTFTAVVEPAISGTFDRLPEGDVEIYDGTTLLGSARAGDPLTWTYATSSLTEGDHEITARYLGDERFLASEGSMRQQVGDSTPPTSDPKDPSGSDGTGTTEPPKGSDKPGSGSDGKPSGSSKRGGLRLPRTGAAVTGLVAVGLAAVAAGSGLLVVRKRRSVTES